MESFIWKDVSIEHSKKNYYKNSGSIKSLIKYIMRDKDTDQHIRLFGGTGIDLFSTEKAYNQMKAVKKYFKKLDGRQMWHYVLSCPASVTNPFMVYELAREITDTYFHSHQVLFAVHEDTDNLHIHFVINSVSFVDGKKWHLSKREFFTMKNTIKQMAQQHLCTKEEGLSGLL